MTRPEPEGADSEEAAPKSTSGRTTALGSALTRQYSDSDSESKHIYRYS
jgi:hypothetical protein